MRHKNGVKIKTKRVDKTIYSMKIFNLIETTIAKQIETKFVIASSGLKNCVEYLTIIEFFVKKNIYISWTELARLCANAGDSKWNIN